MQWLNITEVIQDINIKVSPEISSKPGLLLEAIANDLCLDSKEIKDYRIIKKSIDARKKRVMINLKVRIATMPDQKIFNGYPRIEFKEINSDSPVIVIIGAGPAGLFAALRALELGIKPIVIERGSPVDERRKEIADFIKTRTVNTESNYCFG